jgi:hypothetical protein
MRATPKISEPHFSSQEIENHRLMCEAREWLKRYQEKQQTLGKAKALGWWRDTVDGIEKIRGKEATDKLREAMNNVRHNLQR